jgi:hypothetical protein
MTGPRDYQPREPVREAPGDLRWIHAFLQNLRVGLRIAQFKPTGRKQFVVSSQQALASLGMSVLLFIVYAVVAWQGFSSLLLALEIGWLKTLAASCLLLFVVAYCISALARDPQGFSGFAVIAISAMILPITIVILFTAIILSLLPLAFDGGVHQQTLKVVLFLYLILFFWCFGTLANALRVAYRLRGLRPALLSLLLIGAFLAPGMFFGWYPNADTVFTSDVTEETDAIPADN